MRFLAPVLWIVLLVGSTRAAAPPALKRIESVVTWEDLLKQRAIDVGGGVKVRLGIDSLTSGAATH